MDIRLGLCSAYSFLYGVHLPEKLLDRAKALGAKTVSICDLNSLYGVHTFLEAAKERGIRAVIGTALSKEEREERKENREQGIGNREQGGDKNEVYCFVENREGFGRLCEILSLRNKDSSTFDPVTHLKENGNGLILASTDAGILQRLAGRVKRLYAAITPDSLGGIVPHKKLSLPLAFLDTSVFLDSSDFAVHRVLRAIGLNKTIGSLDLGDTLAPESAILKPAHELSARLNSWPEALRGSAEIAKAASFNELFNGFLFPTYGEDPGDELRRRSYEGAALRYGELGDGEIERIEYELGIIDKMGFSPYFLRMDDIVKMAQTVSGHGSSAAQRTCGRGSGAASIISYALGITNVDPIAHKLYFERFLNPSRPDPPDIDVDFAWDERDALIQAVIKRFGPESCARVANHNFFKSRSALRETAKAYGFSDAEISQRERRLFFSREKGEGSKRTPLEKRTSSEKQVLDSPTTWQEIYCIAARIEGLPRGLGMHCGGLVITPGPVSRFAPIEKSAEGFPLLAWEKEGCEAGGFVKIDLLGNRSLAVIRDALKNLEEQGVSIDPYTWRPVDDKATIAALARGDSMGVFYIESPAMRQLQRKTNKGDFEHIVIHSSIIRPAANKFIAEYVQRLKGKKWEALHPRLEYILDETYGILCYQEDVSKTAVALAGFNEADADKLRKVIAKKAGGTKLKAYEDQFFSGCRQNGVGEETIKKIWAMMLSFDGYSFCKPHSASYAMVSFQSAFLRVHYPAEFIAAVLSNQGGYYRPHAYIAEARRMGLLTAGPDINLSRWKYYGKGREVVIGLMAIKGLSFSGVEKIIEERERNGDYKNLDDFSRRVKPGRDDISALCPAGVFDSIAGGLSRHIQARRLLSASTGTGGGAGQGELFGTESIQSVLLKQNAVAPSARNQDELWEEYRALGFLRRLHPLALWKDKVAAIKYRLKAAQIADFIGRNVRMAGWPVTQKEVWTKDGLTMSFLSLEDETAMYETVVFPQIYDRYNKLLFDQKPLLVYGKVVSDEGAVSLEITKIEALEHISPNAYPLTAPPVMPST